MTNTNKEKFTPGPWNYIIDPEGNYGIYPDGGTFLAKVSGKENACLIAHAPALLDALRAALFYVPFDTEARIHADAVIDHIMGWHTRAKQSNT